MEEVAQLRRLVEDILIRLEVRSLLLQVLHNFRLHFCAKLNQSCKIICVVQNLEGRINALESGEAGGSQSKGPEPILTCVQCLAEYKESENAGTRRSVQSAQWSSSFDLWTPVAPQETGCCSCMLYSIYSTPNLV